MLNPTVTYTNNVIAVAKDLIFGWCIYGDTDNGIGWVPLTEGSKEELQMVLNNLSNPIFPDEVRIYVRELLSKLN